MSSNIISKFIAILEPTNTCHRPIGNPIRFVNSLKRHDISQMVADPQKGKFQFEEIKATSLLAGVKALFALVRIIN